LNFNAINITKIPNIKMIAISGIERRDKEEIISDDRERNNY